MIHEATYKLGRNVVLPKDNKPIYAEVYLKPTLLGNLLGVVYKLPQLNITMKLRDGASRSFRVLSNMMQSSFLISPLVENADDFVFLITGNLRYLKSKSVESFTITPTYGGSIFWSKSYSLKLKTYYYPDHVGE